MKKLLAVLVVVALAGAGLAQTLNLETLRVAPKLEAQNRLATQGIAELPVQAVDNDTLLFVQKGRLKVLVGTDGLVRVLSAGQSLQLLGGTWVVLEGDGATAYAFFDPTSLDLGRSSVPREPYLIP